MSDDLKVDMLKFDRGGTVEREKRRLACLTALRARYAPSALERDSREG